MTDPSEVSVLSILASHANDEGDSCFAGIPRIAKMARRSERTVTRILAKLEKDGWLTAERGDGAGHKTQYHIDVEKLKGCQDVTLLGKRKVTQIRPSEDVVKGDMVTEKGDMVTEKGDTSDKPPHPLIGGTLKANVKANNTPLPPAERGECGEERKNDAGKTEESAGKLAVESTPSNDGQGLCAADCGMAESAGNSECAGEPAGCAGKLAVESTPSNDGQGLCAADCGMAESAGNSECAGEPAGCGVDAAIAEVAPDGDLDRATDWLMRELGLMKRRDYLRVWRVIAQETASDTSPGKTARAMAKAYHRQEEASLRGDLKVVYGVMNFFERGVWKNQGRWHWDEEQLRQRSGASVGSYTPQ
jgi:hypothetical protein